ncbi:MarP family serine protease [Specibacter cremeus]|uniref:MarP family serine protease n=1 Tax=Specibacter cremeus TaxID=1629051 RepID=UPI000F7ACCCC|nr:MarP family serine protease [Specibacter cremeus]
MTGFSLLDIILVLWLLGQTIYGLNAGLVASLGGILGAVAGAIAAFYAAPLLSRAVADPAWRTPVVIGVTILLLLVGHAVGIGLGRGMGRRLVRGPVNVVNRLLGGALNLLVGALLISVLAFGVSNLGIPAVSKALSGSAVITTIDRLTPTPVKEATAQLRSLVLDEGIPQLLGPGSNVAVAPPNTSTDTPAWNRAAASVLKISGTAFQCGQNQTGTGFVVSPGRVLTNAHVVAGVEDPVVQTPNQGSLRARIVYFDPAKDLAVLAVDGLDVAPLPAGAQLRPGDTAAFIGYPLGGPRQVRPATVRSQGPVMVPDIHGRLHTPIDVYQLAGNVQSGNSGGPLLDAGGRVAGVVFAKSTTNTPVGFAFTMADVQPVISAAPMLSSAVSAGVCVAG